MLRAARAELILVQPSLGPGAKEKAPALESNRGRSLRASIQRHPLQVKNEHELNARYIARVPAGLVIFSPQQVARNPWRYSPLCAGKEKPRRLGATGANQEGAHRGIREPPSECWFYQQER